MFGVKCIVKILSLVFVINISLAQDIHFSQYYASPLSLNPANTGFFSKKKDYRVAANYRSQWGSISVPFVTFSGSVDAIALKDKFKNNDWLGAGLIIFNDKAGDGNLTTTKVQLSGTYHKSLDKWDRNILSFGIQPAYIIKSINFSKLVFGNQLDNDGPNGQPSNEPVAASSISYFDLNAGFAWFLRTSDRLSFSIGISAFHIVQPRESFLSIVNNRLAMRPLLNANSVITINDKIDFVPGCMLMKQKGATEIQISAIGNFKILSSYDVWLSEAIVFAGLQFRAGNTDAAILVAGTEIKNVRVGISYDINVSTLVPASNYKGGIELSVIYLGAIGQTVTDVLVPCFRF